MPTIDTDLFQFLVIVLLGVLVIVGLVAVILLSGVKKALEPESEAEEPALSRERKKRKKKKGAPDEESLESASIAQPSAASSPGGPAEGTPAESFPRIEPQQQPQPAQHQYEPEPAAQPIQQQPAEQQAAQQEQQAGSEPSDQPFERDGRWWFRRDNELLVYDEGTGQWLPADQSSVPQPSTPQATQPQQTVSGGGGEASGGFWKCPQCGAVNGSTAASCRMCFTPRPA